MVSPEYEKKLQEVSKAIFERVQTARSQIATNPKTILPSNPTEAMQMLAAAINESIIEAKKLGVSPEKLAPLYNSLKQQLEVLAEIQGSLDRSNKTLIYNKVSLKDDVEELAMEIAQLRTLNQPMRIES